MNITAEHIILVFAVICTGSAAWHEGLWWRRRFWCRACGQVVDIVGVSDDTRPVIEYRHKDKEHSFISSYGGSGCPDIDEIVQIMYDSKSFQAEQFTLSNRWTFTIIPGLFAVMFYVLALVI